MRAFIRRRPYVVAIAIVVLFFLWLAFRPELLFVNKAVNEPFPAPRASNSPFDGD